MGLFDVILGPFKNGSDPAGEKGDKGDKGDSGVDGTSTQLIKLPVNFVLVTSTLNINRLLPVRTAMTDVRAFWALQEIDIQPRISGMVTDESILTVDLPSTELIDRHSGRPEAVR